MRTDVLVVGAGPAGSAAAAWAARAGLDVVLADAAVFPRDKTCGDGLTPRAIGELERLGLGDWVRAHTVNHGLRAHGFGQTLLLPWPGGSLPGLRLGRGAHRARRPPAHHGDQGRRPGHGRCPRGRRTRRGRPGRRRALRRATVSASRWPATASSSPTASGRRWARSSGREWHRDTAYGVAARSYVDSGQARRPVDQQPPRAARRGGRDPLRLRLDLPARRRPGEHRRRHPRHREATGRRGAAAADAVLRRRAPRGVPALRRAADARPRRCCRWAARSPTSPGPTGR